MPRALTILATLCTLTGALIAPLEGATYYVATTGVDSRSCATAQNSQTPRHTPTAGMACLQRGGDTLILHGGTYGSAGETHAIPSEAGSGDSFANPITVTGAPGETVILHSGLDTGTQNRHYWSFQNLIVDNLDTTELCLGSGDLQEYVDVELRHARHSGMQGCNGPKSGCRFIRMRVHHHGVGANSLCGRNRNPNHPGEDTTGQCHGMYFSGASKDLLIDGGEFHDNEHAGIVIYGLDVRPLGNSTIRNARFWNNGVGVLLVFPSGNPHYIYNNRFWNHSGAGVWNASARAETHYYHNTVYGNSVGLGFPSSQVTARNNIVYQNGTNIETQGGNTFSNNLCNSVGPGCDRTGDPRFLNAGGGNFHLQPGSPAIDQGVTLSQVTTDADGAKRPAGGAPDIGAYEYGSTGGGPVAPVGRLPKPENFRIVFK